MTESLSPGLISLESAIYTLWLTCIIKTLEAFILCWCPPRWDGDSSPGRSSDPGLLLAWTQQSTLSVPGEELLGLCCDLSQHWLQCVAMLGLCKALQGISLTLGTGSGLVDLHYFVIMATVAHMQDWACFVHSYRLGSDSYEFNHPCRYICFAVAGEDFHITRRHLRPNTHKNSPIRIKSRNKRPPEWHKNLLRV